MQVISFKSGEDVHDTSNKYKVENISYGIEIEVILSDYDRINFDTNVITATRIDERNLVFCKYLSLFEACTITYLDTKYLINLRVLVINKTSITCIETVSLTSLI